MKTLKTRDPLKLKQSPTSGVTYFLLVLTICTLVGGIVCFAIYFSSARGVTMREYNSDLESWASNDLANKFS